MAQAVRATPSGHEEATVTGTPEGAQTAWAWPRRRPRRNAATSVSDVLSGGELGHGLADFAQRVGHRQHGEVGNALEELARQAPARHALVHGPRQPRRLGRGGPGLERV